MNSQNKMIHRLREIDVAKGLAMLSAICAHCGTSSQNDNFIIRFESYILQIVGLFGVPVFFFFSGMLFKPRIKTKKELFSKLLSIIIPWFFSATVIFLYVAIRKNDVSFTDFVYFVLGINSYCYYLTVMIVFMILYIFISPKNEVLSMMILLGIIYSLFFYNKIKSIPAYINPLNWIHYFSFGQLYQEKKALLERNKKIIAFFIIPIVLFGIVNWNKRVIYWGKSWTFVSIAGSVILIFVAKYVIKERTFIGEKLKYIGENSLFFYLWHMILAGITNKLFIIMNIEIITIFKPLFVVTGVYLIHVLLDSIIEDNKYRYILGMKKK